MSWIKMFFSFSICCSGAMASAGHPMLQTVAQINSIIQAREHKDAAIFMRILSVYASADGSNSSVHWTGTKVRESDVYPDGRPDHILLFRVTRVDSATGFAPIVGTIQRNPELCGNASCTFEAASSKLSRIFDNTRMAAACAEEEPPELQTTFDITANRWEPLAGSIMCNPHWSIQPKTNTQNFFQTLISNHMFGTDLIRFRRAWDEFSADPFVSFSYSPTIATNFMAHSHVNRLLVLSVPERALQNSCEETWLKPPGEIMDFADCGAFAGEGEVDAVMIVDPSQIKDVLTFSDDDIIRAAAGSK